MSDAFSTQDYLRISAKYTANVSEQIAEVKLKYINPNKLRGEWPAVHDAANKTIYYELPLASPLLLSGQWKIWSFATMADGRKLPGKPFTINISKEGE
jgi:hypothetical protein